MHGPPCPPTIRSAFCHFPYRKSIGTISSHDASTLAALRIQTPAGICYMRPYHAAQWIGLPTNYSNIMQACFPCIQPKTCGIKLYCNNCITLIDLIGKAWNFPSAAENIQDIIWSAINNSFASKHRFGTSHTCSDACPLSVSVTDVIANAQCIYAKLRNLLQSCINCHLQDISREQIFVTTCTLLLQVCNIIAIQTASVNASIPPDIMNELHCVTRFIMDSKAFCKEEHRQVLLDFCTTIVFHQVLETHIHHVMLALYMHIKP